MAPWWNAHTAGWIGAIVGSANGILGGVLGTVAGLRVPRGKSKPLVYGLVGLLFVCGVGSLVAGLIALALRQPYSVWYPLVLIGAIDTLLTPIVWPVVVRGYRHADARRLEAEELRRS